jgi:1-acyl-sn-glycerol-3-phosphate acyltransferase
MKLIKEILGRIFAVWAILMFILTLLVFMVPFLLFTNHLSDPKKTFRFIAQSRVWMGIYLPLIGCPLRIRGRDNFAPGQNYVVVCNHNSLMDVPISSPALPGGNKTIAKIEMAKLPVFGLIYRTGSVLVDRKSDKSRKDSYMEMKKVLGMGLHMCIYPEGTRNKSDLPIKAFHDGAFRLALDTRKAVIPGIIFNTRKVLPASKPFYLMPHRLQMHFLPPIPIEPGDTVETLKNRVHQIMTAYYISKTAV